VRSRSAECSAAKIVYAGGSVGGSVALVTAVNPAAGAAGVISLSGGLDGQEETVKLLTVPALYVVTEEDTTGVTDLVKDLHKATAKGRSTLLVYPGAQHAGEMFNDKRYVDKLQAEIEAFLREV
jgi:dienelactone hydrolase